jgi:SAM-dependent methyltransferase
LVSVDPDAGFSFTLNRRGRLNPSSTVSPHPGMRRCGDMLLLDDVLNLFRWHAARVEPLTPSGASSQQRVPDAALADDDDPSWPSARISVVEALWGEGFLFPGGAAETLRLANPMGLTAASSLLLVGAGTGGAPRRIATDLGVWVTGYETNPRLVAIANERNLRTGLGRRAQVELWDPIAPRFPLHYYHHGMAIEPLRGDKPVPTLAAISLALKPGGQFVLVETVADVPLDPADPVVGAWARLDHRPPAAPSELAITRTMGRLGFDVRIVEDISRRHMRQAIEGWHGAVRAMEDGHQSMRQVAMVVHEAELWLARFRLMRAGKLRLVRWHTIGRGGIELPPG